MEMDVPLLIHNLALRGATTSKTNRIGGGCGENERGGVRVKSLGRSRGFPHFYRS